MNPIAFQLGPIDVYWYGILIVSGILLAAVLTTRTAQLWGENPLYAWGALPWVVGLGLLGARLYHALTIPPSIGIGRGYYVKHPLMILAMWEGGLGAFGALYGGTAGLLIAAWRAHRDPWRWMDIAAPGVALGQAIARWGNWVNQEQYGRPTTAPWGIPIQPEYRLPGYEAFERFQPIFAYESVCSLGICIVLIVLSWRYRDRLVPGLIAGIYYLAYATIRFAIEFIRVDRAMLAGLPVAQIVSLCTILLWIGVILWRIRNGPPGHATPA